MEEPMKDSVKCEDNVHPWPQVSSSSQPGVNHRIPPCHSSQSSPIYTEQPPEFNESLQVIQNELVPDLVSMQVPGNVRRENESQEASPVTDATQILYQNKKQRMAVLNNIEELKDCPMSWEGTHMEEVSYSSMTKDIPMKQDIEMDSQDPESPMNSEEQDPIQKAELWVEKNATCLKKSECCSPVPQCGPVPDIQKLFSPTDSPLPQRHCYPSSPDPSRGYFSSSQSPLQSRHLSISTSGFSSPYSHTHSPGLSRNNSDASQYSHYASSYSYSSATSPGPLSPARFSPSQSPVPSRHHSTAQSPVVSRTRVEYLSQGYDAPTHHTLVLPCNTEHSSLPNNIPQPVSHPVSQGSNVSGPSVYPIFPKIEPNSEERNPSVCNVGQEHISQPASLQYPHHALPDSNTSDEVMRDHQDNSLCPTPDGSQHTTFAVQAGISRQQLINSPCPICGDRISGFHYGIFSCESCKGFFKRTVQNKKNYLCLRGANCPVTIATRKKCPACRFERCLKMGMKLEAIREDRTRGGRSTYRCSYTLPNNLMAHVNNVDGNSSKPSSPHPSQIGDSRMDSSSTQDHLASLSAGVTSVNVTVTSVGTSDVNGLPTSSLISSNSLLEQIMSVEHLWHYNEEDMERLNFLKTETLDSSSPDPYSRLCDVADYRLYKIVKWCKSLPLFRNIQMDDQISLLSNAWCELLLFSCCYRSIPTPGEIRISQGKAVSLEQARALDLGPCIERMLTFTEHLRRLHVDQYEYVALKLIILLTSDNSGLKEPDRVRESQEKVLQVLQQYTLTQYPQVPSKFGELLLRIPELERLCQVNKDMLALKSKEGEIPSYHLLMDLLRGDH